MSEQRQRLAHAAVATHFVEECTRDHERFARPINELQAEFTQRFHAFVTGAAGASARQQREGLWPACRPKQDKSAGHAAALHAHMLAP